MHCWGSCCWAPSACGAERVSAVPRGRWRRAVEAARTAAAGRGEAGALGTEGAEWGRARGGAGRIHRRRGGARTARPRARRVGRGGNLALTQAVARGSSPEPGRRGGRAPRGPRRKAVRAEGALRGSAGVGAPRPGGFARVPGGARAGSREGAGLAWPTLDRLPWDRGRHRVTVVWSREVLPDHLIHSVL